MQHLRSSQKREIEEILIQQGFQPGDWSWEGPLPAFANDPSLAQADVLRDRATQHYLAIGHPKAKDWQNPTHIKPQRCELSPNGLKRSERVPTPTWASILSQLKNWAKDVLRERRRPLLWPDNDLAAKSQHLLVSQFNDIFDLLEASPLPLAGFNWTGTAIRWQDANYTFQVQSTEQEQAVYSGSYSPAPELNRDSYQRADWSKVKSLIKTWLVELAKDLDAENNPHWGKELPSTQGQFRLKRVHLHNIRNFRDFVLHWEGAAPDRIVIFGENGSGKSTLLRCLALAMATPEEATTLLGTIAGGLLGGESQGLIEIEICDNQGNSYQQRAEILKAGSVESIQLKQSDFPFRQALAYGSARGLVGATERRPGQGPLHSLFVPETPLLSPELTLRRVREQGESVFQSFLHSLNKVLQLPANTELFLDKELRVKQGSRTFPFHGWADGYRLLGSLMIDLAAWNWELHSQSPAELGALVLIDEVEQHLHPRLQLRLLKSLQEAYQGAHFIVTSHSPLVLLGAEPEEVVVLDTDEDGTVVRKPTPDFRSFSVLEVLESGQLFEADVLSLHLLEIQDAHRKLVAKKRGGSPLSEPEQQSLQRYASQLALVMDNANGSPPSA